MVAASLGSCRTRAAPAPDVSQRRAVGEVSRPWNASQPTATPSSGAADAGHDAADATSPPDWRDAIRNGLRAAGTDRFEVTPPAVEAYFTHVANLSPTLRALPEMSDGGVRGFRLLGIRRGDFLDHAGLLNGDIVESVNGHSVASPDRLLEAYVDVRGALHIDVRIVRRGATAHLLYTVKQSL